MKSKSDNIVSLYKLESILVSDLNPFQETKLQKRTPSLRLHIESNTKFVKPNFSILEGEISHEGIPKIFMFSAPGATGKSELTKYLSSSLHMPVFDLSAHKPVGANSLTGLIYETLGHENLGEFIGDLKKGKATIIIDALDEGYIKTSASAFDSFLDEIIEIAENAVGTPFILLGRTQVMEHCWLYFDDHSISSPLLKLEPFTIEQAQDFIDKQIGEEKFKSEYRATRDYIINSVEGFFKNQSELKNKQYQAFIGYAPVLLSITKLLQENQNYHALLEELKSNDQRGIDLIITIVEYILIRDKNEKAKTQILPEILANRPKDFILEVETNAYSPKEQCIRLIYSLLNKSCDYRITDDPRFDEIYNEKFDTWIKEHPFLEDGKIQNVVFQSYVVAVLIEDKDYHRILLEYLENHYKDAFMLFFVFDRLCNPRRKIDYKFLPYLYRSIKSLDDKQFSTRLNIEDVKISESLVCCELEFAEIKEESIVFEVEIPQDSGLFINDNLSNTVIQTDLSISLRGSRCVLQSPVHIMCREIIVDTEEFVLEKGYSNNEINDIILECRELKIRFENGRMPTIINQLGEQGKFTVIAEQKPEFPFVEYFEKNNLFDKVPDEATVDKYLKLRKILILFRSHSKGVLAKYRDKIENIRVTGNPLSKLILNELVETEVLYSDNKFYYIDPDKLHVHLGLSYNDIKMQKINGKTLEFLRGIEIA
ncbi:NACHT domain-containing protein [Robiginitalea sediminis]|uniref:hypothetical protein n=1 Tax=Robiginitalea sediminis TaxID=1982593 RepID=UPI000B4AEF3D|nr:hypothetical protein [Robiginitalea sediminis]